MQMISRTNGQITYRDIAAHVASTCPITTNTEQMRALIEACAEEHGVLLTPIELDWALDIAMRAMTTRRDPFLNLGSR